MTGCRKPIIKFIYQVGCRLITIISGVTTGKIDKNNYNYEAFLGPDYKNEPTPDYVPTFVCNHTSWLDVMILIIHYAPAFAAKKALRKVPIFGLLC